MDTETEAEIKGVKYEIEEAPLNAEIGKVCFGCVADGDQTLCEDLPDTCMFGNKIWKVKP